MIESDDPEERRRQIEAEQAGANLGAVLGLTISAVMALTEEEEIEEQEYISERYAEEEIQREQGMGGM